MPYSTAIDSRRSPLRVEQGELRFYVSQKEREISFITRWATMHALLNDQRICGTNGIDGAKNGQKARAGLNASSFR